MKRALLITVLSISLAGLSASAATLNVVCLSGSLEYKSDESLPAYAAWLESHYDARVTVLKAIGTDDLPGLEALDTCDVALFFTRRLTITGDQLDRVKKYLTSGRPIVAVRTASHGFQNFLEFDKEIAGGNYKNHLPAGPTQEAVVTAGQGLHPILDGVGHLKSRYSIYRTGPLAPDAQELLHVRTMDGKEPIFWMRGSDKNGKPIREDADHPVAWTREHNGGRVFYTSLGGPEDFENASYQRLIANALYWTARRDPEPRPLPELPARTTKDTKLAFPLRTRAEENGEWKETMITADVNTNNTALILCDVWDKHWCEPATERLNALVPRMDEVVRACREAGIQIIHAPSDTLAFYEGTIPRRRMQAAPKVDPPAPLKCDAPKLPIDDSDGGCTDNDVQPYSAWTREHPGISITDADGISDNGREVYSYLAANGITNLLIMGVHTNMCVLNRTFAIKQMTQWGIHCHLIRDLTDTMYDPQDPPHVPHDQGTELVVEYIEKYFAPSCTSKDLLAALGR